MIPMQKVKLDILSDPICPWCYIGKTHLDKALADVEDQPFEIEWHPFQLNPDMPADGMDRRAYLEKKFGGKEGGIQRTPNTMKAHRLIHWAGLEEKQTAVVDALFKAYFERGQDIGANGVLLDIAAEAGLDRAMVERLLSGDADQELIQGRDAHSRAMGVSSVPTFIVANHHAVPGAQKPELWKQVSKDIQAQLTSQTAPTS